MEDSNISPPPQQTITAPQQPRPSSGKRKILYILLLFLVAGMSFAGAYLWQQSEKNAVEENLRTANSQIDQLKSHPSKQETSPEDADSEIANDETPSIIPGNVDTARTDGRVMIEVPFSEAIEPTALWVEYGLSPTSLNTSTTKYTSGLGMGEPENGYVNGYAVFINTSDLKPGTIYYYRSAATTKDNQTVTSAIASFLTVK